MRIQAVFVSICALILLSQNLFSQRPVLQTGTNFNSAEFYKIGKITGNIGGAKALFMPKPEYPVEAGEAGAEGTVKVEITIDESGSVTAAKAVSGHPALYETAQIAAMKSRFSVPKVGGQGTKVSGFINYNFFIETPNWFKVGYDLAVIEKIPTLGFFQIPVIKKVIQTDWQAEIDLLDQLRAIRDEEKKALADMPIEKPVLVTSENGNRASQSLSMRLNIPPQNPEITPIAQDLIKSLRERILKDEVSLWQFNLGTAFIEVQELYRNPATRQNAIEILNPLVQTAPLNVPAEYLEQLKNLINLFSSKSSVDMSETRSSVEMREAIGRTIANLQKIK